MPEAAPFGRIAAAIVAWLDEHGPATTGEVPIACDLDTGSARRRLIMLKQQGLVSGQPNDERPPRQAYSVTAEGRRPAGIGDRMTTGP